MMMTITLIDHTEQERERQREEGTGRSGSSMKKKRGVALGGRGRVGAGEVRGSTDKGRKRRGYACM